MSTRKVDELVQAMGMAGIRKSTVSKLCKDIDDRVNALPPRSPHNPALHISPKINGMAGD